MLDFDVPTNLLVKLGFGGLKDNTTNYNGDCVKDIAREKVKEHLVEIYADVVALTSDEGGKLGAASEDPLRFSTHQKGEPSSKVKMPASTHRYMETPSKQEGLSKGQGHQFTSASSLKFMDMQPKAPHQYKDNPGDSIKQEFMVMAEEALHNTDHVDQDHTGSVMSPSPSTQGHHNDSHGLCHALNSAEGSDFTEPQKQNQLRGQCHAPADVLHRGMIALLKASGRSIKEEDNPADTNTNAYTYSNTMPNQNQAQAQTQDRKGKQVKFESESESSRPQLLESLEERKNFL
ncbi:hypothetical protein BKA65DRAFT_485083 [Rhexocercosporidium sp. MPI-PUGE-AT-0058]|nr:hypothetical protein BKA65DRAFT_485083 [Rhexocercosporidium sp. MPI-PUGE-AT-0058]